MYPDETPAGWAPPPPPVPPATQPYPPTSPWQPPAAEPRHRSRRTGVLAALVVLVLVLAGAAVGLKNLLAASTPLNYQGRTIEHPMAALQQAERSVFARTEQEPSNRGTNDRCYYAVPTAGRGDQRWEVSQGIYCGPVAFLNSGAGEDFLHYSVQDSAAGSKVTLTASADPIESATEPLPLGYQFARPGDSDRRARFAAVEAPKAPAGSDGLFVSAGAIGPVTDLVHTSGERVLFGPAGGVRLGSLATTPYYGSGSAARSAPAGQRLIAFKLEYLGSSAASATGLDLSVAAGTAAPQPVPRLTDLDEYKVISVPVHAGRVELIMKSGGVTQSLSLLDGSDGADVPKVQVRHNYRQQLAVSRSVPMRLIEDGRSIQTTAHLKLTEASLNYFVHLNDGSYVNPGDPGKAWLHVSLSYTVDADPGHTYDALGSSILDLRDSSGRLLESTNASTDGGTYYVFTVPADFTAGRLVFGTGPRVFANGDSTALTQRFEVPVNIPAG